MVTSSQFEGKWFQIIKTGYYIPEVIDKFTDYFTIEFDFVILGEGNSATTIWNNWSEAREWQGDYIYIIFRIENKTGEIT